MRMMSTAVMVAAIGVVGLAGASAARPSQSSGTTTTSTQTTGVAGRWTVSLDSPHGAITATMVLTQDGTKISGTCTNPHGGADASATGEFVDGKLKLTMSMEVPDRSAETLSLTGSLKDDGTLEGTLTSSMGETPWTATRANGARPGPEATVWRLHAEFVRAVHAELRDAATWLSRVHGH